MRVIPFEQRLHAPLNVALPHRAVQIRGMAYPGVEERSVLYTHQLGGHGIFLRVF